METTPVLQLLYSKICKPFSSSRLAHLDIDGMDQFVGNTLEKAIVRRKRKVQREAVAAAAAAAATAAEVAATTTSATKEAVMTYGEVLLSQTAKADAAADKTVTITKIPSHTLKVTTPGGSLVVTGSGNGRSEAVPTAPNGQTCSTCIASGESSCSSALSSLESVRSSSGYSQGMRSNSGCSETLGSELHLSPKNDTLYEQTHRGQQEPAANAASISAAVAATQKPQKPMRNQQHFNRSYYHGGYGGHGGHGHLFGGVRIVPASSELVMRQGGGAAAADLTGHGVHYDTMASSTSKPYQTLEMADYVTAAEVDNNQNGEQ